MSRSSSSLPPPAQRAPVFLPKTFTCFGDYSRAQFLRDMAAGVTVGFVALPLALALGIASIEPQVAEAANPKVSPPVAGMITAIVAGFLISFLGGTRACIGGPTAAFIVIVASIAHEHGFAGLAIATMMAGVILVAMGLARMGGMIKYIPYPVTMGFTTGIGATIFVGQIKDFLGLHTLGAGDEPLPPDFIGKVAWYVHHRGTIDWASAAMATVSVAVLLAWPRLVTRRVPGPIVVLILATLAGLALEKWAGIPIETIRDRFGDLPTALPSPRLPQVELSELRELVSPALTIALLAGIESLLCAVVADGMMGTRHRSNTELVAQGIANIASPLFGGIPATGAIARTATNIQAGGRTPVAGMVHALTLLAILLFIGKYAGMVPLCVLAAVLMVVAYNMSEIPRFLWVLKGPKSDAAVLLTTFLLTVLTDLTVAVQAGMVLAAVLFIKRMADVTNVGVIKSGMQDTRVEKSADDKEQTHQHLPPGVEVYDINGPFFFGAAFKLRETLDSMGDRPKLLILNVADVPAIDATGLHALAELRKKCAKERIRVMLAGAHAQPLFALTQAGLIDDFGMENLVGSVEEGVARFTADSRAAKHGTTAPGAPREAHDEVATG